MLEYRLMLYVLRPRTLLTRLAQHTPTALCVMAFWTLETRMQSQKQKSYNQNLVQANLALSAHGCV